MIITEEQFKSLLDPMQYQVFIMSTPIPVPFSFFVHTFIVVNRKGQVDRWEMWRTKNRNEQDLGYIHKNTYPAWTGNLMFFEGLQTMITPRFDVRMIGHVSGVEHSLAHRMSDFVEHNTHSYEYCAIYRPHGPNSNTFTQWVLDRFPEAGIILPRRALGRQGTVRSSSLMRKKEF